MALTDEQKECIDKCYENIHSVLLNKSLYDGCGCWRTVDMGEAGIWSKYPIGITEWNEDWKDNIKYFQWGDVEGYTKSQVGVDKRFDTDYSDYKHCDDWTEMKKYCTQKNYGKNGFVDNITTLLPEDDACVQLMGGNWRMPTYNEYQKLVELCDFEWVSDYSGISGLNGGLFTLKTDESKQLFLPSSGYCESGEVNDAGSGGNFWSSSLFKDFTIASYYLELNKGNDSISGESINDRYYGFAIIGILDSNK